jgi:cell division septum initiation protein DivIVA
VIVDRETALNLIDDLRSAVPEEVRAAKRISHDREQIMERSQEEAEQVVARAQEQAAYLIAERGLLEEATAQSEQILAQAHADAAATRNGADEYASSVLNDLAAELDRTLRSIEGGLQLLDERRAAAVATAAPPAALAPASSVEAGDEYEVAANVDPRRAERDADGYGRR